MMKFVEIASPKEPHQLLLHLRSHAFRLKREEQLQSFSNSTTLAEPIATASQQLVRPIVLTGLKQMMACLDISVYVGGLLGLAFQVTADPQMRSPSCRASRAT